MTYSTITHSRTLSALVIACAMAAFFAQPAVGQTAKKLKCNGCVKSKQLKNNSIKSKDIKDGQVQSSDLAPTVRENIAEKRTFFVTAEANGEEATLTTNGPLTFFIRCFINDGGQDRVEAIMTSSLAPWYQSDETARAAGEEVIVDSLSETTSQLALDTFFPEGAVAPDGSAFTPVTSIDLGLNLFSHRCVAYGETTAIKGSL